MCTGVNIAGLDAGDKMFWNHYGMLKRKQISKDLISGQTCAAENAQTWTLESLSVQWVLSVT